MSDSQATPSPSSLAGGSAETGVYDPDGAASELVRVLDQYLADLQAGRAPDKARLLAEHPAIARQLEDCLAGIEFVHRAAGTPAGTPTQLGDFRIIREAYSVLSNPDARVKYDVVHGQQQQDRWKLASLGPATPADRETEKTVRLTILELLSARRRLHPNEPGLFPTEIEKLTGVPREHLEFSTWYLIQKKLAQRSDSSRLIITAEGVDYLDENPHGRSTTPRLTASAERAS